MTLYDPEAARSYYAAATWQHDTLYTLVERHAAERPDAAAFTDSRKRLSWSALKVWVDAVAAELHAAGLQKSDRVACWSPNRVEMVVLLLACSRNGLVCTLSFHQNHTTDEVLTLLKRLSVRAFVGRPGHGADSAHTDIFARLSGELPGLACIYALVDDENPPPASKAFPKPDVALTPPAVNRNPDKVTYLAFTSGTTGQPKALMHTDNTLLSNGRANVTEWGMDADYRIYCLGPLSHHLAIIGVEQALVTGCEYITNDVARGEKPLDRILATGATYVMGVPTHAIDILQDLRDRGMTGLGQVHTFYLSGASIAPETARQILAHGITPQMTYGMTEVGSHTSTLPGDGIEVMTTTVGQCVARANPCYEVRIFDPNDRDTPLPQGEIGEIGGRGASMMLGYYGNQEVTEASFNRLGYFMSGDLGQIDPDGNLRIVGRSKDLIIRGGHNIYPIEIESLALRHPDIVKCAAFAVPDARLGEKVCLAVVLREAASLSGEAALRHLRQEGLSKYDMPEYFMVARTFPTTASGKILKRELVERARRGELDLVPVRWVEDAVA
jgi:acyl-CoA synthetase